MFLLASEKERGLLFCEYSNMNLLYSLFGPLVSLQNITIRDNTTNLENYFQERIFDYELYYSAIIC